MEKTYVVKDLFKDLYYRETSQDGRIYWSPEFIHSYEFKSHEDAEDFISRQSGMYLTIITNGKFIRKLA